MLALTLMVGIVIDDAVVVLENIFATSKKRSAAVSGGYRRHARNRHGRNCHDLSLLAVFLPVGFMAGIVGRFMSSFGFTASLRSRSRCWSRYADADTGGADDQEKKAKPVKGSSKEVTDSPESEKRTSLAEFKDKYVQAASKESRFYRPIDRTYTGCCNGRWPTAGRSSCFRS